MSGGGAAGFELDRLDHRLGSPLNAVVLASSEGHDRKNFVVVHEERLGFDTTIPGETLEQLIRADMTYIEKPKGGAVFSVGSITYCGALPAKSFDNDVSRLTFNVLNRFGERQPALSRFESPIMEVSLEQARCRRPRSGPTPPRSRRAGRRSGSGTPSIDRAELEARTIVSRDRRRRLRERRAAAIQRSAARVAAVHRQRQVELRCQRPRWSGAARDGRRCRSRAASPPRSPAVDAGSPTWPS